MDTAYSIFNPASWIMFIVFVIVTGLAVWFFHRRHPEYPCSDIGQKIQTDKNSNQE